MNYHNFISKEKSLIIAPAGFGKTHSLAFCLQHSPDNEKQLILTHTHAGIASIKEKINSLNIPSNKYHIETISGFAQKYVLAFYCGIDIPPQENSREYFPFIIDQATYLFNNQLIRKIVSCSYSGLFVDEYQDCTIEQHKFIIILSELLPTHILGDPLQGIYDFTGTLVNFTEDLKDFEELPPLEIPWRWKNANNEQLGHDLANIREKLELGENIDLKLYDSIEFHNCNDDEWCFPNTDYRNTIEDLLSEESLLLIHPTSSTVYPRESFVKSFNNRLFLLESIDSKECYKIAKLIDNWDHLSAEKFIRDLSYELFSRTPLNNWFNDNGLKRKREIQDRQTVDNIKQQILSLQNHFCCNKLVSILKLINDLRNVKCYRKSVFYSICNALKTASIMDKCVYDGMVDYKNIIRRTGKKINGRCIGTTLLTKGLEFDTVAIINAHKFDNDKHFYVAITRASKRLVIFSNSETLSF